MFARRSLIAALAAGALFAGAAPIASAQGAKTYKVGVLVGLSGLGAQIGQWMLEGAESAAKEINAASGDVKFQIVAEDTQWNAQKGVEGFNKLVNVDKIDVLLTGGSAVMQAVAPLADQRGVVLMNVGAQAPSMAGIGKFTFSVLQLADFDIRVLTKYAYEPLKLRNVAMLYINNDTGKFNQEQFAKDFQKLGGKIAAAEAFRPNETNYGSQLAKIRAANPDAIYVVGTPAEMPFAVKQTRALMANVAILSYSGMESQEFLKAAGESAEGIVYTTTAFDPSSSNPRVQAFVKAYQAFKNAEPSSPYVGYGYDAIQIVTDALKRNGGKTGDALRATIHDVKKFPGVTGDNVFQADGTVSKAIAVKKVEGGQFKVVTVVEP